ncbi:MAG: hypothetical protein LYZ70_02685 [Nitrososphaerales archaeon]|nr:hypothetical protein [Nitrososphaerales archaeon]
MQRELAFCRFKTAFQAEGDKEFASAVELAKSAYQSAIGYREKSSGAIPKAQIAQLQREINFAGSYISASAGEKRRLLQECSRLEREALEVFERAEDSGGALKASISLLDSLSRELNMEWSPAKRLEITEEALSLGGKAIRNALAGKGDLAWAHYYLGLFSGQRVYLLDDSAARQQTFSDSLEHVMKAIELSTEVSDRLLQCRANLLAISRAGVRGSPQLFKLHLKRALDSGLLTKDNEAIADALLANAYDLVWEMASQEVPESRLADFEKCRSLTEDALTRYRGVLSYEGVANCYALGLAQAYNRLAFAEVDQTKRSSLLEKAAKSGREALENFKKSGAVGDETPAHTLMIVLYYLASITSDREGKKRILDEASQMVAEDLRHRESTTPFHSWNRGVALYYEAIIHAELSKTDLDPKQRVPLLIKASNGVEDALKLCKQHFEPSLDIRPSVAVGLGTYAGRLHTILEELYGVTGDQSIHEKMISSLREAAGFYEKAGWPSRAAEAHWKLGQLLDRQRRYTGASDEFETASRLYDAAAKKTPQFKEYFQDYVSYMAAWSEIDKARLETARQNYGQSAVSYSKSSELLRGNKRWGHLADHFDAWAKLQTAEALSAKENFSDAMTTFREAQEMFVRVEARSSEKAGQPPGGAEAEEPIEISQASSLRKQYCEGRGALEEARMHDVEDDKPHSASLYGLAAKLFGGIAQSVQSVAERHEMTSIAQLCRGWQLMKEAEEHPSLSLYTEAAETFAEAAGSGAGERVESVASADSHFCRAMNFELEFEKTGDPAAYSEAKSQLQGAKNLYLGVDFQRAADWTEAAMMMLDSRLYAFKAETSVDAVERAKLYASAEKSLEFAASLCEKAGYRSKSALVESQLVHVKQRAQTTQSLAEIMTAPSITTPNNLVGIPDTEEARGLTAFEGVNIQARLRLDSEVEVGETLQLQLDLFNTGLRPASLLRVEEISPKGFKPAPVPEPYLLEDSSLNTKGRLIQPLQVESFVIPLEAQEVGVVTLNPKLVYVDEGGRVTVQALAATSVKVLPQPVFEFKKEKAQVIFECLIKAFVDDYMRKRLSMEQSGWRSLVQIAETSDVSRSSLYGRGGKYGPLLYELVSRGLVETRTFTGQRGRGGEVIKVRIAYSRDSVKRRVDRTIMKSK